MTISEATFKVLAAQAARDPRPANLAPLLDALKEAPPEHGLATLSWLIEAAVYLGAMRRAANAQRFSYRFEDYDDGAERLARLRQIGRQDVFQALAEHARPGLTYVVRLVEEEQPDEVHPGLRQFRTTLSVGEAV